MLIYYDKTTLQRGKNIKKMKQFIIDNCQLSIIKFRLRSITKSKIVNLN